MSSVDKEILAMLDKQLRDKVISFAEYMQGVKEVKAMSADVPAASTSPSVDNQDKKYSSKKAAKRARQRLAKKESKQIKKEEPKPIKVLEGKPVKKRHQKKEHIAVSLAKDNIIEKSNVSKKNKSNKYSKNKEYNYEKVVHSSYAVKGYYCVTTVEIDNTGNGSYTIVFRGFAKFNAETAKIIKNMTPRIELGSPEAKLLSELYGWSDKFQNIEGYGNIISIELTQMDNDPKIDSIEYVRLKRAGKIQPTLAEKSVLRVMQIW
jgi:hypothetical protein